MRRLLVTGSSGLVGSGVCNFFAARGWKIIGIDNNQRAAFFGPRGDTSWNLRRLRDSIPGFEHHGLDIRDRGGIAACVREARPDAIVHCAAQPSHDLAAKIPFDDFETNAVGTLNLLEAARAAGGSAPFVLLSTNKVYGDGPNAIPLREEGTRWEYDDPAYSEGIPESFPIDRSTHSLFGVSKASADLLVQEYGRYFGMPTCSLRAGCLTGPDHSGVELHGFLSYLVRSNLEGREYTIFGYKGKQVRDNLHAEDAAAFIWEFIESPRSAEVYNMGGGRDSSCSIHEAFAIVEEITGREQRSVYVDKPRIGDHICYYSDLRRMRSHYPGWKIRHSLRETIGQIAGSWQDRAGRGGGAT
jgi:CDP-paratose 2-epimerase